MLAACLQVPFTWRVFSLEPRMTYKSQHKGQKTGTELPAPGKPFPLQDSKIDQYWTVVFGTLAYITLSCTVQKPPGIIGVAGPRQTLISEQTHIPLSGD